MPWQTVAGQMHRSNAAPQTPVGSAATQQALHNLRQMQGPTCKMPDLRPARSDSSTRTRGRKVPLSRPATAVSRRAMRSGMAAAAEPVLMALCLTHYTADAWAVACKECSKLLTSFDLQAGKSLKLTMWAGGHSRT